MAAEGVPSLALTWPCLGPVCFDWCWGSVTGARALGSVEPLRLHPKPGQVPQLPACAERAVPETQQPAADARDRVCTCLPHD